MKALKFDPNLKRVRMF